MTSVEVAGAPGGEDPAPRPRKPAPIATWVVVAVGLLVALRVAFWFLAPPNSDEAYYWLWGLHPAASYFDHPPLLAWVNGAVHAVLGQSRFALRLPAALATAGSIALVARLAARLGGGGAAVAAAALLGSPLLSMLTAFAWHDAFLVLFVLLAGSLFAEFLAEVAAGGRGHTGLLFAAAVALGLAGLSKYNALFLAVGVLATIAMDRRLRPLLRDGRLWLAGAICLAVVSPVLLWNAAHGLSSFRFHLAERHGGMAGVQFRPLGVVHFIVPTVLLLSAPLLRAIWVGARAGGGDHFAEVYRRLALVVAASSTATFLLLAATVRAQYYWNVVAWVVLLPLAAVAFAHRPRLLGAHVGLGLAVAAAMVAHGAVFPLSTLVPGAQDDDSLEIFGWDRVAEAVREERREHPTDLVGAGDYRPSAHLAWALGDPAVAVLSRSRSQFAYWLDRPARAGASALLVTDHRSPIAELAERFDRVTHLRSVVVSRLGVRLKSYELWRGEGFRP